MHNQVLGQQIRKQNKAKTNSIWLKKKSTFLKRKISSLTLINSNQIKQQLKDSSASNSIEDLKKLEAAKSTN